MRVPQRLTTFDRPSMQWHMLSRSRALRWVQHLPVICAYIETQTGEQCCADAGGDDDDLARQAHCLKHDRHEAVSRAHGDEHEFALGYPLYGDTVERIASRA